MALDREQRKIVRLIRREGRNIKDPRARKVYERAAVQTGLVESNLRNLDYGDADSQGWRQERASLYKNPTNLHASIRRFREEFQQLYDPGEKSYEVAAQVQRPAEQFRGRYHDVAGQAAQILKGAGGGPSAGPNAPRGSTQGTPDVYSQTPGVDNSSARMQLAAQYFANPHDPGALLAYKAGVDQAQDTPGSFDLVRQGTPGGRQQPMTQGGGGDPRLSKIKAEADLINAAKVPYLWGGGHAVKQKRGSEVTPLDCSGAVSRVLGIDPRVSGQFESWGKAGRAKGKGVTVYANDHHVLMEINGHFFGTSSTNPGGGAGWIKRKDVPKSYLKGFTARHL